MDYLIKALAAWRLTKLLMDEDGPQDVLLHFRHGVIDRREENAFFSELAAALACKYCLSVWIGLALALLPVSIARPFALSAAVLFLEKHYGKG